MCPCEHPHQECACDERLKALLAENLFISFELLMLAYQHKLMTFVCLIYDQRHAEDIVQETFINAYKALLRFSALEIQALRLRPWLFRIAYNLVQNHRTRSERFSEMFAPISLDLPEGKDLLEAAENGQYISAESEVEWQESREELFTHIRRLPRTLRLPLILHYLMELEYHEIAEKLGQPLNTVKSSGLRGLQKLREMMREEVK